MSKKLLRSRCARFEPLEPKELLAGDVVVSVVDGRLIVEGDELANQIAITAGPEPGSYVVQGLDDTNVILQPPPEGGQGGSSVVVHGVRAGAIIGMGDGDDRVVIRDARFHGDVNIRMDGGNDQVVVGPTLVPTPEATAPVPGAVGIAGSLRIGTGEGDDRVHVGRAAIRGSIGIETASGNDAVVLGNPPDDAPSDPAALTESDAPEQPMLRPAELRAGRGIHVHLGEGDDTLAADLVHSAGGLVANSGTGSDRLGVHASRIGGALLLYGGDGDDQVVVNHVAASLAGIRTGDGNDHVRIVDSLFHVLGVDLGAGDDSLALEGNAAQVAILLGGEGEDMLLGVRNNRFGRLFMRGFELPTMDGSGGEA